MVKMSRDMSRACFSAVVFSVISFTGHLSSKAAHAAPNVFLFSSVKVGNHVAAGDFAFMDNSRNLTFSASVSPVLMRIILSSWFMKY